MSAHEALRADHHPDAVSRRLGLEPTHGYLGDAIFGAVDGCVTTFAVVAGAMGANLTDRVVLILGIANLVADGFSMAASNYLGVKSDREHVERARQIEEHHVESIPEGEREEIRQIFARKGFTGEMLERIVAHITQNKTIWVDTMLQEELGLQTRGRNPARAAAATFGGFVSFGMAPLISFLPPDLHIEQRFIISTALAALAFAGIGFAKALLLKRSLLRSSLESLIIGCAAAALAYGLGLWLHRAFGINE